MASLFNVLLVNLVVTFLLGTIVSKGEGSPVPIAKGLSYTYYSTKCPNFEAIARRHLVNVFKNDITQSAGLLRVHFHDCFVQGCDASVLLDGSASGPGEKDAPPNLTLRPEAFKIINRIRQLIQRECGRVVSCADITALAARDSIYLSGGPFYAIPYGRKDGLEFATRNATLANLPGPQSNTTSLLTRLALKNFDATDVVALSGAHTIGRSTCSSFAGRLSPPDTVNPMEQTFADSLKLVCPTRNTNATVNLDVLTPNQFDNKYYVDLVNRKGLFTSDQTLFDDSRTKDIVTSFANDQKLFFDKFVIAMLKMGQLDVLTGTQGEIRANCSARNGNDLGLWSVIEDDQQDGNLAQF